MTRCVVHTISLKESTVKQKLHQLNSYLKQEPDVKSLRHDARMMDSIFGQQSFCNKSTILVRQSKSPEHPHSYMNFSQNKTPNTPHIVTTIDFRAQILNMFDCKYGIGVPVFKLAPVGHEQLFSVISPDCSPRISDDILQHIVSEGSAAAQNRTSNV